MVLFCVVWGGGGCQVGASLGGAIAINLATDVCPELVDKVVLLDGQVWCCCMCGCLLYIYMFRVESPV